MASSPSWTGPLRLISRRQAAKRAIATPKRLAMILGMHEFNSLRGVGQGGCILFDRASRLSGPKRANVSRFHLIGWHF